IVPSTVEMALAVSPMMSEFHAALSISSLVNSLRYQSRVNPTHGALRRESLKEYATTITSGAYKNAYAAKPMPHSQGERLMRVSTDGHTGQQSRPGRWPRPSRPSIARCQKANRASRETAV